MATQEEKQFLNDLDKICWTAAYKLRSNYTDLIIVQLGH